MTLDQYSTKLTQHYLSLNSAARGAKQFFSDGHRRFQHDIYSTIYQLNDTISALNDEQYTFARKVSVVQSLYFTLGKRLKTANDFHFSEDPDCTYRNCVRCVFDLQVDILQILQEIPLGKVLSCYD